MRIKNKQADYRRLLADLEPFFAKGEPLGGGAAAAIAGLLVVNLLKRVVTYSRLESRQEKKFRTQLAQIVTRLTALGWEDGLAFKRYLANRQDPARQEAICAVPLEIALILNKLAEMSVKILKVSAESMQSDAWVAQSLLGASFRGALVMGRQNLPLVASMEQRQTWTTRLAIAQRNFAKIKFSSCQAR